MTDLNTNPVEKDANYKKVMNLYAAFGVSMILTFIPSITVAIVSLFFILGVLIAAYKLRKLDVDKGLLENHCTFIIRTIWIGSFYAAITTIAGSAYMINNITYDPFIPCANDLVEQQVRPDLANMDAAMRVMEPCIPVFMQTNQSALTVAFIITAVPVLLFFFIRYFRGFARAYKGYRLANVKSWI